MGIGNFFQKVVGGDVVGKGRDVEYDDDYYEEADEQEDNIAPEPDRYGVSSYGAPRSAETPPPGFTSSSTSSYGSYSSYGKSGGVTGSAGSFSQVNSGNRQKFRLAAPEKYSDVRKYGELYKDGFVIALQLDKVVERKDVRRIVDFFMGVAFALGGTFKHQGGMSYLVLPATCEFDDPNDENSEEINFAGDIPEIFS